MGDERDFRRKRARMTAATPIVLDCDPGHDDAMALLLAVGSTAIDLRAVTVTFGNCAVEDASRNARRVLTLAGAAHVPVGRGASGPLTGETFLGNYVHGISGLDGPDLPEPAVEEDSRDAIELLHEVISSSAVPITIIATGPITNIAHLLQRHPQDASNIARIVFMGGSTERGNHTPYAEFNTFADPEALDLVLNAGLTTYMVGLNLTHQALATDDIVERMRAMPHVLGQTAAAWMGFFGTSYNRVWRFDAPPVHDPCTIAAIIDPDLITWQDAFVAVETVGPWTRGATAVDLFDRWPERRPNAHVGMQLDSDAYWELVLTTVDSLGRSLGDC